MRGTDKIKDVQVGGEKPLFRRSCIPRLNKARVFWIIRIAITAGSSFCGIIPQADNISMVRNTMKNE